MGAGELGSGMGTGGLGSGAREVGTGAGRRGGGRWGGGGEGTRAGNSPVARLMRRPRAARCTRAGPSCLACGSCERCERCGGCGAWCARCCTVAPSGAARPVGARGVCSHRGCSGSVSQAEKVSMIAVRCAVLHQVSTPGSRKMQGTSRWRLTHQSAGGRLRAEYSITCSYCDLRR